jgi:aconitate hydratase
VIELDLSTVEPCVSGPKRPHDRVTVSNLKKDFNECMQKPNGFKGFGVPEDKKNSK